MRLPRPLRRLIVANRRQRHRQAFAGHSLDDLMQMWEYNGRRQEWQRKHLREFYRNMRGGYDVKGLRYE